MNVKQLHPWDVSPAEARAIQERLRHEVVAAGSPSSVRLVAGTDIAVGAPGRPGRAAVVVVSFPDLEPVEQSVVETEVTFPYVPGLLSFREIPLLVPALERLRSMPDLLVVDGQGMAHPRRLGIASHLGLMLDMPVIGCAKSRLTGRFQPVGSDRGAMSPLTDHGEVIGAVVRTRTNVSPLFVSVGNRIGLNDATWWILNLTRGLRQPEPTRLAHRAAAGERVAP